MLFRSIIDGGPVKFLEQNLLRFPQAMSASSVYGSAIHKALEDTYIITKKDGNVPTLQTITEVFNKELKRGRLTQSDEKKFKDRGEKALKQYYELKKNFITGNSTVELNFAKQSVMVDGALLTGKIDQIVEGADKAWIVTDLKTGKGFSAWEENGMSDYEELKLHHYRHQLMMYKILVENSRDYSDRTVTSGILEFVEEVDGDTIQSLALSFGDTSSKAELERTKDLAVAVYKKIVMLDFPDTNDYPKTLEGIRTFEDDVLAGL